MLLYRLEPWKGNIFASIYQIDDLKTNRVSFLAEQRKFRPTSFCKDSKQNGRFHTASFRWEDSSTFQASYKRASSTFFQY